LFRRGAHCGGNRDNKVKSVEISSIVDGGYFTGMGDGELKDTSLELSTSIFTSKIKEMSTLIIQSLMQFIWH